MSQHVERKPLLKKYSLEDSNYSDLMNKNNIYTESGFNQSLSYGLIYANLWFFDTQIIYSMDYSKAKIYFTDKQLKTLIDKGLLFIAGREHWWDLQKKSKFYQDVEKTKNYIKLGQSEEEGEYTKGLTFNTDYGKDMRKYFKLHPTKNHVFQEFNPNTQTWRLTRTIPSEWTYSFFANLDVKYTLHTNKIEMIDVVPPSHLDFWKHGYNILSKGLGDIVGNSVTTTKLAIKEYEILDRLRDFDYPNILELSKENRKTTIDSGVVHQLAIQSRKSSDIDQYIKKRERHEDLRRDYHNAINDFLKSNTLSDAEKAINSLDEIAEDLRNNAMEIAGSYKMLKEHKLCLLASLSAIATMLYNCLGPGYNEEELLIPMPDILKYLQEIYQILYLHGVPVVIHELGRIDQIREVMSHIGGKMWMFAKIK